MTEHPITARFRAWRESVADVIKCDVIDPGNLKRRCEFSSGHEGKHDFEKPFIRVRPVGPIPKAQRVGTWKNVGGDWCIKIPGGFQKGDIVPVRRSDGRVDRVMLGVRLGKYLFTWAGDEEESGAHDGV